MEVLDGGPHELTRYHEDSLAQERAEYSRDVSADLAHAPARCQLDAWEHCG